MYTVSVYQYFSAAHYLREYKGKCEKLHGHNWKVSVECSGTVLDSAGLLVDFGIIKKALGAVLDGLDHRVLNDEVPFFASNNPSAENIARFVYVEMKKSVATVSAVTVNETENSSCRFVE